MSRQSWQESLVDGPQAPGTLYNTYTAAQSVLPAGCLYTLAPNFWVPGKMMRMTLFGAESHRVTGPDTMSLQFMLGTVAAFTSGPLNLTTTAHTLVPFKAECVVTCQVGGKLAQLKGQWTVEGQGFAMAASLADNAAGSGWAMGPNTAPALGPTFDATVAEVVDFWVAQSFSGAGNGIQIHQYLLEALN
jgi:hypothetical protein